MLKFVTKLFGNYSAKEVKKIMPTIEAIEDLEPQIKALSDEQLKAKTVEFKSRLAEGETLDDILPEAFAVTREAAIRTIGQRHYKVQLVGGIILHQGRIAEMKTGEGKTLVATLPVYLNALEGKGVHIVTVNDYLAKRDSEWMGKIYRFLGLSVGLIIHEFDDKQRRESYNCDITYGTNNEFGFDYLRDNMVTYKEELVQRDLHYAIVDEVDSILVDEARTPLIISGAGDKSTDMYAKANEFAKRLKAKTFVMSDDKSTQEDITEDYIIDEKANTAALTAVGIKKAERFFGIENLSDPENITVSHHINQAIRAHGLMKNETDYVVKDGEVLIVDEFTGRIMYGRRYSEGLHQAIEAKENVKVERESKTLATITFQNYFRLFKKLSGMTGTAMTEEEEFKTIYKLDVIEIPTNMPMIREDHPDSVFKNINGKYTAIINEIAKFFEIGTPVLIGTISIEKSEILSAMLKRKGVPHQVLNAKYHEREAEIIAQAGKFKAVTIATNMAGRGTDIVLGGNPEFMVRQDLRKLGYDEWLISQADAFYDTEDQIIIDARAKFKELLEQHKKTTQVDRVKVLETGGLHIIGTERHESRRIDNQLRGRSGRQGDPGSSRFYISLEDDLMRLFGQDRLTNVVNALGLEDDQPIEHRMLSNAIESAQKRVEGKNFDIRKHTLQFDDVMNKHREVIYNERRKVLDGESLKDTMLKNIEKITDNVVKLYCSENPHPDFWDWEAIKAYVNSIFPITDELDLTDDEFNGYRKEDLHEKLLKLAYDRYDAKEAEIGSDLMREIERVIMLRVVDQYWMDHIDAMDQLKNGINLRAYAQRDPIIEYKFEGFEMFEEMIKSIQEDVVKMILNTRLTADSEVKREKVAEPLAAIHGDGSEPEKKTVVNKDRVGRNDECPCGSGKKYKNCHGA